MDGRSYSAFSTRTRCETARIMPRTATLSGNVTATPIFESPRPRMVRLCCSGRLIPLRTSVTRSLLAMSLLPDLVEALAAQPCRDVRGAKLLERVDGCVD